MSGVEVFVDRAGPLGTGGNAPVVPRLNQPLALQLAEMDEKPLTRLFIFVRVRKENLEWWNGAGLGHRFVLVFANTVTYSCRARPVRADIVWPTAKAVGGGAVRGTEPAAAGDIAPRKCFMSPLVGLLQQQAVSYPSAVALGHIIAALPGLADPDTDTPSYL